MTFDWKSLDNRRIDDRGHPVGGLPKYCDPTRMRALFTALEQGMYPSDAAVAAGIDRGTLAGWRETVPEIASAVTDAETVAKHKLLTVIRSHMPTNWQAAGWMLERRWPSEYGRRDRVHHEGTVVGAIMIKPAEMTSEAIMLAAQLEEELAAADQTRTRALPAHEEDSH